MVKFTKKRATKKKTSSVKVVRPLRSNSKQIKESLKSANYFTKHLYTSNSIN